MYRLSKTSKERLSTCDERIQKVINKAITICPIDFGVAEGHRTLVDQKRYYKEGKSRCDGVEHKSKHQSYPSVAIDLYAYKGGKALWDTKSLSIVAGCVLSVANDMGISLEWGGDWQSITDMPHFQLKDV